MIEWRKISGFSNYEVSYVGQVRRITDGKTRKTGFCLAGSVGANGYIRYTLRDDDGARQNATAHRLVALAFIGKPLASWYEVAHNDGNKLNNFVNNLRWATRSENANDTFGHGTIILGERHHAAKFTKEKVIEIRNLHKNGRSAKSLAREFKVHSTTIDAIVKRQTWAHVSVSEEPSARSAIPLTV